MLTRVPDDSVVSQEAVAEGWAAVFDDTCGNLIQIAQQD
jgi:hypothetical protein